MFYHSFDVTGKYDDIENNKQEENYFLRLLRLLILSFLRSQLGYKSVQSAPPRPRTEAFIESNVADHEDLFSTLPDTQLIPRLKRLIPCLSNIRHDR